jgi:phosphopantothenoylcysteine decarboxylase/phosphopantothenate--cysteine ligase
MNSLNDTGAGFNTDTNKITLLDKHNNVQVFPLKSKSEVAIDICNKIVEQLKLL